MKRFSATNLLLKNKHFFLCTIIAIVFNLIGLDRALSTIGKSFLHVKGKVARDGGWFIYLDYRLYSSILFKMEVCGLQEEMFKLTIFLRGV